MDICLIRHGETDGNARRLLQAPETPLSPQGMAQARLVARRLADERIAGVLTSDLRRAAMTAEMIAEAAAVSLEQSALLRERNFGELRGLPYDGLGVNIFAPGYDPPGGETWGEFLSRIDSAWDLIVDVAARAGGRLAVVTHGYFLFTLAGRRLPVEGRLGSPPAFANTSVTVVDHNPPHAVRLLNCTRHLEGSGPL